MSKEKKTYFSTIIKRMVSNLDMHPNFTFYMFVLLILILVPVCLLVTLQPITGSNSTGPVWINFWGSFLGGLIGAVITYIVMNRTFSENNKNNETERDASFRLHRAETLRNDYREVSKCINLFVDQIQELFSGFQLKMFSKNNNFGGIDQVVNENALEVKANLKRFHDTIFDIPISDNPAKHFLQKIEETYLNIISSIDHYSVSLKNTCNYIAKMEKEDIYLNSCGDINYIETPAGLTPFNKTIFVDTFSLSRNRSTDNLTTCNSSTFLDGWVYPYEENIELSWKDLENGLFLVSSPLLTQAFLSSNGNEKLYEVYRQVVMRLLYRINSYDDIDANFKNFQYSIEKYLEELSFDYLAVIPIVIIRKADGSTCNSITDQDEICPIEMTDTIKEQLLQRVDNTYNFGWSFDDHDSIPHCRFEIDNELRKELFTTIKNDYLFDEEDDDVNIDNFDYSLYLDFVFMDLSHPEINLLVTSHSESLKKILSLPSEIGKIHNAFHHAIKRELSELTIANPN